MLNIGKPRTATNGLPASTVRVGTLPSLFDRRVIRDAEPHSTPTVSRCTKPQAVLLDKWEDFFVSNGVHIADDCKFDIAFNQPREELTEQRKRGVSDNDVCFIAEFRDLLRAEVAITLKVILLEVFLVQLAVIVEIDPLLHDVNAPPVPGVIFVEFLVLVLTQLKVQ